MKLICLKCGKGTIQWSEYETKYIDDQMTCQYCKYVYEGMGEYIKIMNELHQVPEEVER